VRRAPPIRTRARRTDWFRTFFDRTYVELLSRQWDAATTCRQADVVWRTCRLRRGARVLDVGCGFGRHAAVLARRGADVTGVDLSTAMLAEARRRHAGRPRLRFVRGDMRRLAWRDAFDAVVSLFASFGYFDEAGNRATLRGMVRALRPGGRLCIDVPNPAFLVRRAEPRRWRRYADGWFVCESATLARGATRVSSEWWLLHPPSRTAVRRQLEMRNYTLAEWRRRLRAAGVRLERVSGSWDGHPAGTSRNRLILVARRPS
jgi:SAM-dependent methyltransferase